MRPISVLGVDSLFFPANKGCTSCMGVGGLEKTTSLKLSFPFYINLKHFVCRVTLCFDVAMLLSLSVKELVHWQSLGPGGTRHHWSKNFPNSRSS